METAPLTTRLKEKARELGFALSGVAPATDADGFARFEAWLDRGFAGEMSYLPKLREEHRHPSSILDGVRKQGQAPIPEKLTATGIIAELGLDSVKAMGASSRKNGTLFHNRPCSEPMRPY